MRSRTSRSGAALGCALFTAVAALATVTGSPASATSGHPLRQAPRATRTSIAPVLALPADSLVDAYGVNVHMNFQNTPYKDYASVSKLLGDLGVRHVRDSWAYGSTWQAAATQSVSQTAGVRFDEIMGNPASGHTPADYVTDVSSRLGAGTLESLEGVNEWDHFGPADDGSTSPPAWVSQAKSWQHGLYTAADANPTTRDLPVLSPSLADPRKYATIGDLSADEDLANLHIYPGGYRPSNLLDLARSYLRSSIPTTPVVVTESGYHDATGNSSAAGVPEAVAGVYAPRMLLEHLRRGEQRVYDYELIDQFDDPGRTDPEKNYGLVRHDLSPKPAYTAMQNLLGLLNDPGPAFTTTPLAVTASGMPSDARYQLYEKRNGRYVLLLWRDVNIYDPSSQQNIAVTPAKVTVSLGSKHLLTVRHPSRSGETAAGTVTSSLPVSLDGDVTAILIDPATPPSPKPQVSPGAHRATLTWSVPTTSAAITGFEAERSPDGATRSLAASARSFIDTGLDPAQSYSYRIRSVTEQAVSPWISSSAVVPALAPGPPAIVSARPVAGGVQVTWRAAAARGSSVTAYRLQSGGHNLVVSRSNRSATLRGLPAGVRVRVAVQARNAIGWGARSLTGDVRPS